MSLLPGRTRKTHCPQGHPYNAANTYWQTNRHGNLGQVCRECQRLRMQRKRDNPDRKRLDAEKARRWREQHPAEYWETWQRVERDKRRLLLDARAGGCIRCGEKHPACLDFHHRDPSIKEGHIGEFRRFGKQRLLTEIAKCDVLCANCHRKHHHDERQKQLEGVE